jgi:adenylosuccinate synthase
VYKRQDLLAKATPVYIKMKGWEDMDQGDWNAVKESGDIPKRIQDYMDLIEREVHSKIVLLSYGKDREDTIDLSGDML